MTQSSKELVQELVQAIKKFDYESSEEEETRQINLLASEILSRNSMKFEIDTYLNELSDLFRLLALQDMTSSGADNPVAVVSTCLLALLYSASTAGKRTVAVALFGPVMDIIENPTLPDGSCVGFVGFLQSILKSNPAILVNYQERILKLPLREHIRASQLILSISEINPSFLSNETAVENLVSAMKIQDSTEVTLLLYILTSICKENPQLLIPHVGSLSEFLENPTCCGSVSQIYTSIALFNPEAIAPMLDQVHSAALSLPSLYSSLFTRIIGSCGTIDEATANKCASYLIQHCKFGDGGAAYMIFRELSSISEKYPNSVQPHLEKIIVFEKCTDPHIKDMIKNIKKNCGI